MAKRNELLLIRAARAGQAAAQLALGRHYLFGGNGQPQNLPSALYWLDRAALQDEEDAWLLIGSHVPFEIAQRTMQPDKLCIWYERAFDAGVAQAGLVLAKLVLEQVPGAVSDSMRSKALRALQNAAHAGITEAQWLLARVVGKPDVIASFRQAAAGDAAASHIDNEAMRAWAVRAARSGEPEARYALADHAWTTADYGEFLAWALPIARTCAEQHDPEHWSARDAGVVSRCAHAMLFGAEGNDKEALRFLELAAHAGESNAQFSLGVRCARMDAGGIRVSAAGAANYKKAIRWLTLAGERGMAEAWYALSKIYLKPECSQRSRTDARRYLQLAAEGGHGPAQLELGKCAWRARGEHVDNDVRAAYWLHEAEARGIAGATGLLDKVAPTACPAPWAGKLLQRMTREARDSFPLMTARLELAACFGLTRTEALLLEPATADRGHCLVIDIRAIRPHARRRLILLRTAAERQTLARVGRLFAQADGGLHGREGNYRQRLYRLKTLA